jgi:hypothetical protein
MRIKKLLAAICILFSASITENINAQSVNDTVIFNELGKYDFNLTYSGYTPLIDRLGRPYVYLATKELGLVTFNISNTMNPVPVDTQSVASLGNLKVTGIAQDNDFLLISLGDFQGAGENAGLAIFNVTNPVSPVLLDRWDTAAFHNGTATVIFQDNYAYLGAMSQGVVILDISDKQNIQFVSRIIPDTTFGNPTHAYHARGLFVSGDTLLVAYDNGGIRVIDVANKQLPVEIGKYKSSTITADAYPFYNHVYRIGNYAYCALDYCGIEVVDVNNPALMTEASWLNPWNCSNQPPPFGTWNGSDGHTNEIAYASSQNVLFFSGGDSQILAFDPSDPLQPRIMGAWGPANDSVGTWGTDTYGNLVALANVKTFGFPFVSTVGGLQLLSWNFITEIEDDFEKAGNINVYPNPADNYFVLKVDKVPDLSGATMKIMNAVGANVMEFSLSSAAETRVDTHYLPSGIYFINISQGNNIIAAGKIIIE